MPWRNNGNGTSTWIDAQGNPQETKLTSQILHISSPSQPVPGAGQVPTPNGGTGITPSSSNIDLGGSMDWLKNNVDWGSVGQWLLQQGKGAANFATDHIGDVALGTLAAIQANNAGKASQRSGALSDQAIQLASDNWANGAPLRAKATSSLLTPSHANLSTVTRDRTNPFSRHDVGPPPPPTHVLPSVPPITTPGTPPNTPTDVPVLPPGAQPHPPGLVPGTPTPITPVPPAPGGGGPPLSPSGPSDGGGTQITAMDFLAPSRAPLTIR